MEQTLKVSLPLFFFTKKSTPLINIRGQRPIETTITQSSKSIYYPNLTYSTSPSSPSSCYISQSLLSSNLQLLVISRLYDGRGRPRWLAESRTNRHAFTLTGSLLGVRSATSTHFQWWHVSGCHHGLHVTCSSCGGAILRQEQCWLPPCGILEAR